MIFLPIVGRELRVAARRRATHWTCTTVALGAIATCLCFYVANMDEPPHTQAQRVFTGLMVISFVYSLAAGRRFTADCLSEEKREGTLGLLFLTDLKGYDVVLGKIAATSLNGFYGLLAVVPVLAVPVLLGGVGQGEFWRTVLVLVNTFFYALAIGIFVSTISREAPRAMGANLLMLLLLSVAPPLCGLAMSYHAFPNSYPLEFLYSCPAFPLVLSADAFYKTRAGDFWWSVAVMHALIWLLLSLACGIVPHSWHDKAGDSRRARWHERWLAWRFGNAAKRKALRQKLLNRNPFFWLAARSRLKPAQVWGVLLLIGVYWAGMCLAGRRTWLNDSLSPINVVAAILFNSALKMWIGLRAGYRLAQERKMGTFELLLSTALTDQDILKGQWLALRRQFLKPTVAVIGVECLFLAASLREPPSYYQFPPLVAWLACLILLVADMLAVSWVAMACALTARTPNLAAVQAIARVLIMPLVVLAIVTGGALAFAALQHHPEPGWRFWLGWWFGLGMAANLAFGFAAWHQLHTRFRRLASQSVAKLTANPAPGISSMASA